jgi:hypothetical protein
MRKAHVGFATWPSVKKIRSALAMRRGVPIVRTREPQTYFFSHLFFILCLLASLASVHYLPGYSSLGAARLPQKSERPESQIHFFKLNLPCGRERRSTAAAGAPAPPPPRPGSRGTPDPFSESLPIIDPAPPIPADLTAVLHAKHRNTGRSEAPSPRTRPPRFRLQPELSDRQFLDRLKQTYLKQVHDARARPRLRAPARPFQSLAQALHTGTAPLPALEVTPITCDELFEEEEERILAYEDDPLNRLLDPDLRRESDSFSSFETLSVREDSDGNQAVISHHHPGRSRPVPRDADSEAFQSLSASDDTLSMRDSEWLEMSEASFREAEQVPIAARGPARAHRGKRSTHKKFH